jgi:hypothetical protein
VVGKILLRSALFSVKTSADQTLKIKEFTDSESAASAKTLRDSHATHPPSTVSSLKKAAMSVEAKIFRQLSIHEKCN